jgi:hypothetical protein
VNINLTGNTDLAWLAGFWDADGCIGITKRQTYLVPYVSCSNTNKTIIDNVMRILDAAEIKYLLEYSDRGNRINAAPSWAIRMEGRPRVTSLLNLIEPYLVGKNEQAKLVINWCKGKATTHKVKGGSRETRYPEGYWETKDTLTELNARGRVRG